jgi:hypothetical protein
VKPYGLGRIGIIYRFEKRQADELPARTRRIRVTILLGKLGCEFTRNGFRVVHYRVRQPRDGSRYYECNLPRFHALKRARRRVIFASS